MKLEEEEGEGRGLKMRDCEWEARGARENGGHNGRRGSWRGQWVGEVHVR